MQRRSFLRAGAAPILGASTASPVLAASLHVRRPRPLVLAPLAADALDGSTELCRFQRDGQSWIVYEDLRTADGPLRFVHASGVLRLDKRVEAVASLAAVPYLGLALRDIALADRDLLADRLLAHGEPDPIEVRDAAPPNASAFDPKALGARLPWTAIVGTRQCTDTMPVFPNGNTRTYRPHQFFPELADQALVQRRLEGLLGGWLPAVHKVFPASPTDADGRRHDLLVFGDVAATDLTIVQTWHRSMLVDGGRIVRAVYGHTYTQFPAGREPPAAAAYYAALLGFAEAWHAELADMAGARLPDPSWNDMARHAFAKELIVRPAGTEPKYGAVDRDYVGSEYDGFQDTYTSSLYANLEWGRHAQARAVLDGYMSDYVFADGVVNMRGGEVGQYGLMLALTARYLQLTHDRALLRRHVPKLRAIAVLLVGLHDASLQLPADAPGHGLLHGWSESDACLMATPSTWWQPYFGNSALVARGLHELAAIWTDLTGSSEAPMAADWRRRASQLRTRLNESLRASIRHDLTPPYVPPLPGVTLTFRQSLAAEHPSPQAWPHRVYAELLQADMLDDDLTGTVIDAMRGHGATTLGVVANIGPPSEADREILGFISYGYALALLRLDRIDEYLLFLYSHRHHAHTPGSWTAAEVASISGDLPLFCMPAQMTIPLLLRWMLVFEDSDADVLHLGRAVPRTALVSGAVVGMDSAPTRWGSVDFSVQRDPASGRIAASVVLRGPRQPAEVRLSLRLPVGMRLVDVQVDGRAATPIGPRGDVLRLDARTASSFRVVATTV